MKYINATHGMFPAAEVAARLVVESSPKDWSFAACLYMIDAAHLQQHFPTLKQPDTFVAFTNGWLDSVIEPYLQKCEMWSGPGPVIVYDARRITGELAGMSEQAQFVSGLGVTIHEAAHVIDHRSWKEVHNHSSVDRTEVEHLKYIQHGARFVRTTLHLWHRVNEYLGGFQTLPLSAVVAAGEQYSMSPTGHYLTTLQDELKVKRNQPIGDILLTEFPKFFGMLWREDLHRTNGQAGAN